MNANRRFLISFVAYLAYFVLLFVGLGASSRLFGANPEAIRGGLPQWAGIPLFGALMVWPLPVLLYFFYHIPGWKKQVQRHGKLASAQVLSVKDSGISTGGSTAASFYIDLAVRVMPSDEPTFDGGMEVLAERVGVPAPGEVIMVRYDPANHRHIAPARDLGAAPTIFAPAMEPSALDLRMSSTTISELAGQLRELDERYRAGSLSDQEFRTAKKRLLA